MQRRRHRARGIELMHKILHRLVNQRAFAHVHMRRHFIADAPDEDARVIAMIANERAKIALPPGAVRKEAVPLVESLVEDEEPETPIGDQQRDHGGI